MDVEGIHEAFDLLCRAGVRLSSAFAPFTFWLVLHSTLQVIYLVFQFIYNLLKSTQIVEANVWMAFWLLAEIFSLVGLFLSADLPASQVSRFGRS